MWATTSPDVGGYVLRGFERVWNQAGRVAPRAPLKPTALILPEAPPFRLPRNQAGSLPCSCRFNSGSRSYWCSTGGTLPSSLSTSPASFN